MSSQFNLLRDFLYTCNLRQQNPPSSTTVANFDAKAPWIEFFGRVNGLKWAEDGNLNVGLFELRKSQGRKPWVLERCGASSILSLFDEVGAKRLETSYATTQFTQDTQRYEDR